MEHPPEATPATPKQEKLLRHLDRWRDGMTKADASTTLQTYYDEPADPGQRVRLQQLGRWHDGMTRGQARDALKGPAGPDGPQTATHQASSQRAAPASGGPPKTAVSTRSGSASPPVAPHDSPHSDASRDVKRGQDEARQSP